jgi:phosphatidylinositol 4-phosphatase
VRSCFPDLRPQNAWLDSKTTDYSLVYYFLLWFMLVVLSLAFIFVHGIEYVNWPRLLPLSDIIHYDGPGFRSGNKGKGFGVPALDPRRAAAAPRMTHKRGGSKLEEIEMGTVRKVE